MNIFDRAILNVFPKWGTRRIIANRQMRRLEEMAPSKRSFEAISGDRLHYDFLAPSNSPTSALAGVYGGVEKLRNHVRQLEYNNGFVSGPIQRIASHVVGTGFNFQSRVKADQRGIIPKINQVMAERFNTEAELYFARWSKQSDKRLISTFPEQCFIAETSLIRDGAILAVGRNSKRRGRIIPYCLELLEIDRLQTPLSEITNTKIRNGILFDDEGVPETYYILKVHPGDTRMMIGLQDDDYEEIPAFNRNGTRKVMHLYNPLRPEQEIGFSQFAAALKDLQDLDRIVEAEKYAMLEDACLTGIVTSKNPVGYQAAATNFSIPDQGGDSNTQIQRGHEFGVNKFVYLNPDEDFKIHAPSRPNDAFAEIIDQLSRGPANALDTPPEIYTQNWHDVNYSNARTILMMFDVGKIVRQAYLISHLAMPVWENVANDLVVHGKIQAPAFDRRREDYLQHMWIEPGRDYIDPVKEAKGKEIELDNNITTLTDIHASKGKDFEQTIETRARELARMKELEKEYDIELIKKKEPKQPGRPEDGEEGKGRSLRAIK